MYTSFCTLQRKTAPILRCTCVRARFRQAGGRHYHRSVACLCWAVVVSSKEATDVDSFSLINRTGMSMEFVSWELRHVLPAISLHRSKGIGTRVSYLFYGIPADYGLFHASSPLLVAGVIEILSLDLKFFRLFHPTRGPQPLRVLRESQYCRQV